MNATTVCGLPKWLLIGILSLAPFGLATALGAAWYLDVFDTKRIKVSIQDVLDSAHVDLKAAQSMMIGKRVSVSGTIKRVDYDVGRNQYMVQIAAFPSTAHRDLDKHSVYVVFPVGDKRDFESARTSQTAQFLKGTGRRVSYDDFDKTFTVWVDAD